jgi:hypothetical protein
MLFSGYICNEPPKKVQVGRPIFYIKKLLIRALTKSPGVSTSGLSFFREGLIACAGAGPTTLALNRRSA